MSKVVARWVDGVRFVHTGTGGHSIVTDGLPGNGIGQGQGFKPSELLLAAIAGCSGYDVAEIMAKQRQKLTSMTITVNSTQASEPPNTFESFDLHFTFRGKGINETFIKRAIELSKTKYCSVIATVAGKATVATSYDIEQE
jgi:putative redox protein